MPIVEIHATPLHHGTAGIMLRNASVEGARALGCPPSNVWSLFLEVTPNHYYCGGDPAPMEPEKSHPPLVYIRLLTGRTRELKTAFANAVATAVGIAYGLEPSAVWIHFQEIERSEVYTGGNWVDTAG
jgi:phenylpyruvate tautomerase PptA (4-oxalocrotonate tautomerase family)